MTFTSLVIFLTLLTKESVKNKLEDDTKQSSLISADGKSSNERKPWPFAGLGSFYFGLLVTIEVK